ncbi:hypothetical protein L484_023322 [Morus notabilis]|uniref:RNase H type-1 domain-containing protein n=1 Tax=Morus notabilis TaxID=981085 RepID=W9RNA7_9ROSA|nr:hypothetical protein L484_023322 [Morus notabilis]
MSSWAQVIETDSSVAASCIQSLYVLAEVGAVVDYTRNMMTEAGGGNCCSMSRECNRAAHTLAQFALSLDYDRYWLEEVPDCTVDVINADLA